MTTTEITFDKLLYIDRLKSGGIEERHARAHAEALDQALRDTVATKLDLATAKQELRDEIRSARDELRDDIQSVRDELRNGSRDLRGELTRLDNKIDNLDSKIDHKIDVAVRDLKIWLGGIIIIAFGAPATIKFFG